MKYLVFLLFSYPFFALEKKPFEIRDLYKIQTPGSLAPSPVETDTVLLTVSSSNMEEATSSSQIFRLNLKTSELNQLTYSKSTNAHPFWSPDGKTIYFLSTREEGMQLWAMEESGGEARQVTHFETGIEDPKMLPDGKSIIFSSTVFPECMEDSDCNREMSSKLQEGPTQAHLADNLLFRHWTSYRDFQYTHLFILEIESGKITALTKGKHDYPTYGGSYDVSPDGNELVITVNTDPDPEISTNSDLYLLDLTKPGSSPRCITSDNSAFDGDPCYSPDGRYIAYRRQNKPMYESDLFVLTLYDRTSGTSKNAAAPFDNWIDNLTWSPDSKTIYLTAHEEGYFPIYQFNLKSPELQLFQSGVSANNLCTTSSGLLSIQSSVGSPREVFFKRYAKNETQRQVSQINSEFMKEVDVRSAESVWVKGADGKPVHVFIVKPHGFDPNKTYPLILNVHGGPQYQWADTFRGDWQVYPGSGYIVAFPNPHGSSGYGQAYTEAISGDYNGKVMEDIKLVTNYLAKLPYVDEDRMGAMGWSWGGYAMMWLEGQETPFKALSSMMGIYDLSSMYAATEELWFVHWDNHGAPWDNTDYYKTASPSSYVKNFKTPCLVITGERDYRVPYTQSLQFFTALQRMSVPSRLIVFSNDGHWPNAIKSMPVYYNAHLEWFHTYLGGEKAPYNTEKMIRNIQFSSKQTEK